MTRRILSLARQAILVGAMGVAAPSSSTGRVLGEGLLE